MKYSPVFLPDIIGGQTYIAVRVVPEKIFLEFPVFCGRPVKVCERWWIRKQEKQVHELGKSVKTSRRTLHELAFGVSSLVVVNEFVAADDYGLQLFGCPTVTPHRVFRYNFKTRCFLDNFVRKDDLPGYFKWIGYRKHDLAELTEIDL